MTFILDETTESVVITDERRGDDDNLDHLFCECDENRALCGADLTDVPIVIHGLDDEECIVCRDLEWRPCERCGQ